MRDNEGRTFDFISRNPHFATEQSKKSGDECEDRYNVLKKRTEQTRKSSRKTGQTVLDLQSPSDDDTNKIIPAPKPSIEGSASSALVSTPSTHSRVANPSVLARDAVPGLETPSFDHSPAGPEPGPSTNQSIARQSEFVNAGPSSSSSSTTKQNIQLLMVQKKRNKLQLQELVDYATEQLPVAQKDGDLGMEIKFLDDLNALWEKKRLLNKEIRDLEALMAEEAAIVRAAKSSTVSC